jgi:hypothetical protein
MANIRIASSQAVVDQGHLLNLASSSTGSLDGVVDSALKLNYAINSNYYYFSSWSLAGNTLRTTFSNGATQTYTGTLSDPSAYSGTANVSNVSFNLPNAATVSESGSLNYVWQVGSNKSLTFATTTGQINSYAFTTHFPVTSSSYNAVFGNSEAIINGNIAYDSNNNVTGTVASISMAADKYLKSALITGNFSIAGNASSIGQGLAKSSVSGNLTSYSETYYDGSTYSVDGLGGGVYIQNGQAIDAKLLANSSNFPGDDIISIQLPNKIYENLSMASGNGNDALTLKGGGGMLSTNAGPGNDSITLLDHGHQVDGGIGFDTLIYQSSSTNNHLTLNKDGSAQVTDSTGSDSLTNVERIQFTDKTVALDINATAGQAYRIYQAAFNRTPDNGGLKYWIGIMDSGVSLSTVSSGFIGSAEFQKLYGTNPTNELFVTKLYDNVLHRTPDSGGYNYWVSLLNSGGIDKISTLVNFSESNENQAGVIGVIQNGIDLFS